MLEPTAPARSRRAELDYFHRLDTELVDRARAAHLARQRQDELAAALGTHDAEAVNRLYVWGMRADSAALLEWLPALEVAWLDGADEGERQLFRERFNATAPPAAARQLLEEWLARRPSHALFAAGRIAIRRRLQRQPEAERLASIDRIVRLCEDAGRAAGGVLGFGALSNDERHHIEYIRHDLERED